MTERKTERKRLDPSGLNVIQNEDGSFSFEWDPTDDRWNWMNDLTDEQIRTSIEALITEDHGLF